MTIAAKQIIDLFNHRTISQLPITTQLENVFQLTKQFHASKARAILGYILFIIFKGLNHLDRDSIGVTAVLTATSYKFSFL